MENAPLFNPLDKRNLGKSVVDALLKGVEKPLASIENFIGAGVYAIYYSGDFSHYAPLSALNKLVGNFPIYIGKAIPKGGRKGTALDASLDSTALSKRLQEHAASIMAVPTLSIKDFTYRSLIVDDIWISLGEAFVIQQFQPLWNQVVDGFGNHDPGAGRYSGKRPLWDELHPGRSWAKRCQPSKFTLAELLVKVDQYMLALTVRSQLIEPTPDEPPSV
jgi:Eco29kI restriction endonuclease